MATTELYVAHTGHRHNLDATHIKSLDELKGFISRIVASVPAENVIVLTPQGKPLKFQTVLSEKLLYVYDNRVMQPAAAGLIDPASYDVPAPPKYHVPSAPEATGDRSSITTWQQLFRSQRTWAGRVVDDCVRMSDLTQARYDEMDVMMRCLDAAVANLESVVQNIQTKHTDVRNWIPDAQADYSALVNKWEQYLSLARSIPISASMARFMTGQESRDSSASTGKSKLGRQAKNVSLEDLVDLDTTKRAGRAATTALRKFTTRVADFDKSTGRLDKETQTLLQDFEKVIARSTHSHAGESSQLLGDIEALAKKLEADYQTSLEYSTSTRDVLQASKIAANHSDRLIPSVRARALEMEEMSQYATQARNALVAESIDFMRNITDITSLSSTVKSQLATISQEDELAAFDHLRLIQQLPYMYASFVAEAIKRREWLDKMKADSTTLANEMALFQDEEMKRRKKWHKSVGETFGPSLSASDDAAPGLEVNLLGDEDQWPAMTRADLDDLLAALEQPNSGIEADILNDIRKLVNDLNSPTKQQSKRLKAFKNGSVHEANLGLGRSGLLVRGDDDLWRALQEDKVNLASKLKTAESRVRRLEDLLHRQSQAARPNLGSIFQSPSQQLMETGSIDRGSSPVAAGSKSSRRASDARRQSLEATDLLVQRVQQLEDQLSSERERSAIFERDLTAHVNRHSKMKGQMDEANSTKKDLFENMEAQRIEYQRELKGLEDEVQRLNGLLEDREEEMDHFGESREHEKAGYDERVLGLEQEVQRLQAEKSDEALKTKGQVEFLRKEARLQRELAEGLEKKLQTSQEETKSLKRRLDASIENEEAQFRGLQAAHESLAPNVSAPSDLQDLIEAVTSRATDVLASAKTLEGDMALLKAELDETRKTEQSLREDIANHQAQNFDAQRKIQQDKESLSEEKARAAALEQELSTTRQQAEELRSKIADGETGSEALRTLLADHEKRLSSLTEELATRQSQVGSLEEELVLFKDRLSNTQTQLAVLNSRFDARTGRAKDLTQRLYSQNDRLYRLLTRLGFSYARQNGSMVIQKLPRAERSPQNGQTNQSDTAASLRRSATLDSLPAAGDAGDLDLLYWTNSTDDETESEKYEAYLETLGNFDMDAFSEAVYRRLKDIEHMARKLQRSSAAYRDRSHALQKDAHDKIAYKNFKEGDLALFLPTRNQTTGAWAAFNVGFPHFFLNEQEHHRLQNREWLLARISHIQERVVDLSKSLHSTKAQAAGEADSLAEEENDNPFDLSDGLRWYLIDAHEDKPGAPATPGMAKTTVAANTVEAVAEPPHSHAHARNISTGKVALLGGHKPPSGIEGVSKTLSKSLDSRRSSGGSSRKLPFALGGSVRGRDKGHERVSLGDSAVVSETNSLRAARPSTPLASSPVVQQSADLAARLAEASDDGATETAMPRPPPPKVPPEDHSATTTAPVIIEPAAEAEGPVRRSSPAKQPGTDEVRHDIDFLVGP
jgi:autophagy-related protein 11